jgi:hypothetical protein
MEHSFIDDSDGTITDTQTELIWQKEDDSQKRTLEESNAYCKSLRLGGYEDWRLPTIAELRSISTVWKQLFANSKNDDPYWSSTVVKNQAWVATAGEQHKYVVMVLFSDGSENTYFQYYKYYTRAVRGTIRSILKALQDKNATLAKELTNTGGNLFEQDEAGNIPLHYAAGLGYTDLIRDFLRCGVPSNYDNRSGQTPLHYAMQYDQCDAAKVLWAYQRERFKNEPLSRFVVELCTIGVDKTLPKREAYSGFVLKDTKSQNEYIYHSRARLIGQQIYEMGGFSAMQRVAQMVDLTLGGYAASELSRCWDVVGDWVH